MANRSTFSRALPRDLTKLAALGKNPDYTKKQRVTAVDFKTGDNRRDADGNTFLVTQILPDYDRMLRLLFQDAHKQHRGFKTQRLARELAVPTKDAIEEVAEAA